ncbi:MAG TPA: tricarboxylate transporter, partial [Afifellaceae bacterium]|nr:tricarboxylate transporter [Afifellaceae bacterium]
LIGFVLADQAEVYTYQATQIAMTKFRRGFEAGIDYIFTPTVLILIVITVVSVWLGARQNIGASDVVDTGKKVSTSKTAPMIFAAFVTGFMMLMFFDTLVLSVLIDKVFPLALSAFAAAGGVLLLLQMARTEPSHALFADAEETGEDAGAPHGLWATLAWFFSLLALTALFGFVIALTIFFVAFLGLREKLGWGRIAVLTGSGVGLLLVMAKALNRDFPPGLLQSIFDLPWPFR